MTAAKSWHKYHKYACNAKLTLPKCAPFYSTKHWMLSMSSSLVLSFYLSHGVVLFRCIPWFHPSFLETVTYIAHWKLSQCVTWRPWIMLSMKYLSFWWHESDEFILIVRIVLLHNYYIEVNNTTSTKLAWSWEAKLAVHKQKLWTFMLYSNYKRFATQ